MLMFISELKRATDVEVELGPGRDKEGRMTNLMGSFLAPPTISATVKSFSFPRTLCKAIATSPTSHLSPLVTSLRHPSIPWDVISISKMISKLDH